MTSNRNMIVQIHSGFFDTEIISTNILTHQKEEQTLDFTLINKDQRRQFCNRLQSLFDFKQIKAFVFRFMDGEYGTVKEAYEFRRECREFCRKYGIFCYFTNGVYLRNSDSILQTHTMVKEGESVLIIDSKFPFPNYPVGYKFIREANYYRTAGYCSSVLPVFSQEWKEEFMGDNFKPKRIILLMFEWLAKSHVEYAKKLYDFFKQYCPVEMTYRDDGLIIETISHQMNEKINPYAIAVTPRFEYYVKCEDHCLIKINRDQILPLEESVVIDSDPVKTVNLLIGFGDTRSLISGEIFDHPDVIEEIKLSTFKSKKVKITLQLDINSFYDLKIVRLDENGVEIVKFNIAESCTTSPIQKARLVFDKQNFFVSLFKDNKEYIIHNADGKEETPLYIAFNEKKPVVGNSAMEIYSEKPEFVVFDLIKLASITNSNVENPKWRFRLSKSEAGGDESMLVAMQTMDGEKFAPVSFLLAFFIKDAIKRIYKEAGQKMKEIEIGFAGFSANEVLKKNLIQAGEFLKIDIVFV